MTNASPDPLDAIARALADGKPVDFTALRDAGTVPEAELRALELVHRIRNQSAVTPLLEKGVDLGEEIGHGSHGRVLHATDRALKRQIAVKIVGQEPLSPAMRQQILNEARTLAGLDHENIVRIFGIDEVDGKIQITFEKIDGRTLEQILAAQGPLAPVEAAHVALDLCRALAAIHGRRIVHRDLKPANVMRAQGGRIVLLDFGIAASSDPAPDSSPQDGAGTPLFMAPEQFESPGIVDARTDLFALGGLLYWLVSGQFPFAAADFLGVRERVVNGQFTPLADVRPNIPPAFAAIVHRALARDKAARFQSAGEFEQALRQFVSGSAAANVTTAWRWPVLAACAILVVGALAWALFSRSAAPDYEFSAHMGRLVDDRLPPQALDSGDLVHIGDRLVLTVHASQPLYVYVLNEDRDGVMTAIFPFPDGDLQNPLLAGDHRLPGPVQGDLMHWPVNNLGGGEENFLVIASPEPIPVVEDLVKQLPSVTLADPSLTRELVFRSIHLIDGSPQPDNRSAAAVTTHGLAEIYAKLATPVRRHGKSTMLIHLRTAEK